MRPAQEPTCSRVQCCVLKPRDPRQINRRKQLTRPSDLDNRHGGCAPSAPRQGQGPNAGHQLGQGYYALPREMNVSNHDSRLRIHGKEQKESDARIVEWPTTPGVKATADKMRAQLSPSKGRKGQQITPVRKFGHRPRAGAPECDDTFPRVPALPCPSSCNGGVTKRSHYIDANARPVGSCLVYDATVKPAWVQKIRSASRRVV